MCNNTIHYYIGEEKYVEATVTARNPAETVVINSANFELCQGDKIIKKGNCEINGAKIKFLLSADTVGVFELKISVSVGAETFIEKSSIHIEG